MKPFTVSNELLSDPRALRKRLGEEGYLFIKKIAPADKVLALRRDVLELCAEAGWVDRADLMAGRWSGAGPYTEGDPEYMAVYKKIVHLPRFAELPADEKLMDVMSMVLDAPAMLHRRHIGRISFPNNEAQSTGPHQDFFYIRGTPETYTMWMPLGECPMELGGLAVMARSHQRGFIEHFKMPGHKFAGFGLPEDRWPKEEGVEWAASHFELGDVLIFHSHTIHKALPNKTGDRLRVSIDNRYQRREEAIEPSAMKTHYNL